MGSRVERESRVERVEILTNIILTPTMDWTGFGVGQFSGLRELGPGDMKIRQVAVCLLLKQVKCFTVTVTENKF